MLSIFDPNSDSNCSTGQWNTSTGFIGGSLDFHASNQDHELSFLFIGNYILYFTVALKQNKHFKMLWIILLPKLEYIYGWIFAAFILQTGAEGAISLSYQEVFYIRYHLWGQEDTHGHLQYSQQQCDFHDNAITFVSGNENSNLLFAGIKHKISGGIFCRHQAWQ